MTETGRTVEEARAEARREDALATARAVLIRSERELKVIDEEYQRASALAAEAEALAHDKRLAFDLKRREVQGLGCAVRLISGEKECGEYCGDDGEACECMETEE